MLWITVCCLCVALLLLRIQFVSQLENRVYDFCFGLVHWYTGHAHTASQIGFVAIDDKSVDPDYSPLSSPWGKDGWLTRSLWNLHLLEMGKIFKPKVLAYDILFRPLSSHPYSGNDDSIKTIRDLEEKGDEEFQNQLANFEDLRSAGEAAPKVLFAYDFAEDAKAEKRTLPDEQAKQKVWFARLNRFRLPPGSVYPGGKTRVFDFVRLPMDRILSSPSYYLGAINAQADRDGTYRRVPLIYAYHAPDSSEINYVPSFTLEAFLLWLDIEPENLKKPGEGLPSITVQPNGELVIQTERDEWRLPVDDQFRMALVPRFTFNASTASQQGVPAEPELARQSFVDLLRYGQAKIDAGEQGVNSKDPFLQRADLTAKEIQGRILVIGESFTGGTDVGNFPLEPGIPRAMLHMHALNNILSHDHLFQFSFTLKALLCVLLAAIMAWLYILAPPRLAGLGSFALIIGYPFLVLALLMARNVELPLIAPTVLCASCFGLISYEQYQQARRGRETMRRLFSSATSPRVLRLLEEDPTAFYAHQKTKATMLFSDVEGFTSLSEKLDPAYLASLINRYLTPMTAIIVEQDGYLDKYSGDGIMAAWGVPFQDDEQEYRACVAACRQIQAAAALQETLPDGKPYQFRVRIGINTGQVSAGNMGSDQKKQYTVMGDEVNLAARLEPTNKDYGTLIIIGPETYAGAKSRIRARMLDKIIVKGRSEAVLIYELLGLAADKTPAPGEWLKAYEQGLEQMWKRQWDEADQLFEKAIRLRGEDSASELQRARIREYRQHTPPSDWQGEFVRLKKD